MTDHETLAQWCGEQAEEYAKRAKHYRYLAPQSNTEYGRQSDLRRAKESDIEANHYTTIATLLERAQVDARKAKAFDAIVNNEIVIDYCSDGEWRDGVSAQFYGKAPDGGWDDAQEAFYEDHPDKPSALLEAVEQAMGERV